MSNLQERMLVEIKNAAQGISSICQVLDEMETDRCTVDVIRSNTPVIREGLARAATELAGVITAAAESMESELEKATA